MRPAVLLLAWIPCCCCAQTLRGDLLSWSGTDARGELVFRDSDNGVHQCSYDERSVFERASERVSAGTMVRGDRLQVRGEPKPESGICYARTVEVEQAQVKKAPMMRRVSRPSLKDAALDFLAPRGDLTYAGVVLRVSAGEMLLRMRSNERKTILLRDDTRFLGDGQTLERGNLRVNTRVYITAGRNWKDQVEAYQVVWGDILEPVTPPRIVP